jgi:hypothetical protein
MDGTRVEIPPRPVQDVDVRLVPPGGTGAALVVDLPGASGVDWGLSLAGRGYQPVPLYNMTTGPGTDVVDVWPLIAALRSASHAMASQTLPDDAPPAFLIDSQRLSGAPQPSMYDNRWMIFPQDFPSARMLREGGASRVLVVRHAAPLLSDLRAVLRIWKREGIDSATLDPATGAITELTLDLSIWAVLSDHLSGVWSGLRENSAGGFGGPVPRPRATTGGFG